MFPGSTSIHKQELIVITVSGGRSSCVIDKSDLSLVGQFTWQLLTTKTGDYAIARIGARKDNKQILMHRLIMGVAAGILVDHIDGNGLNNSRSNLRLATKTQNNANTLGHGRGSTGYKGVFVTPNGRFKATISGRYLGTFDTAAAAAQRYDQEARLVFGEFACPNFP